MKIRTFLWLVPAALLLGGCKKKEQAQAPEPPAPVESAEVTPEPEEPAAPEIPALSAEERGAMLGFARHLPQDTGIMISYHNGSRIASSVKTSKLWKLLGADMGANVDIEEDDAMADGEDQGDEIDTADDAPEELTGPAALFAREFTIALGPQVGEQTAHLLALNSRSTQIQMSLMVQAFAEAAESGDFSNIGEIIANRFSSDMMAELLEDPESGVALFERMSMPSLYLAFRTTEENRAAAAQQLASISEFMAFFGDIVETVEVERAGQTFAGQKISGAKIAESMAESRAAMEANLEPATVDKLIAAISKKDLVMMSGTIGEYALLFIGASPDDLVLAEDLGASLVSGEALSFCDAHNGKDLAAVIYGQKEALTRMIKQVGGLSDMTDGLRDGLAATETLGDTRDLQALLRMVGERETALQALSKTESTGMTAYLEDGIKIEMYGGTDNGAIDWQAANRLSSLGDSSEVALFANMTSNQAYDDTAKAYFEALMETAYALAMKVAEFPMEDEQMIRFREMAGMFDEKFRPDVLEMWDALSNEFSNGLAAEAALVVDLKGTPPPVPGLPQDIVDNGKFPRITYLAPVKERAQLAAAWQRMHSSATSIVGKIGEMTGNTIPMQKPISSERNGFTTWFFSVPFFTEDFMPSVTVGDAWFAASTSKNQALDLITQADKSKTASRGLKAFINFAKLREFATISLDLLQKHQDTMPIETEVLEQARDFADAMSDFEKLTLNSRMESGKLRTSIHLKTP